MRVIQGFSLGGEFTGSMVYTTELASPLMRGLVSSSTAAGTTLGFILGSRLRVARQRVARPPSSAPRGAGAFRSSAASVFCVVGWLLRRGIHETARRPEGGGDPAAAARRRCVADWRPIVQTFGIVAMTNAAYYLTFTYAVERRKQLDRRKAVEAFLLANTLSLFVVLFAKPLGGWLSDRIGRRRLMIVAHRRDDGADLSRRCSMMLLRHADGSSCSAQMLLAVPLGMALGLQGAMVVEIFPLRTRVTSMSFAYSITLALAGGTAPLVSTWLIETLRPAARAGVLHHAVRRDRPRHHVADAGDERPAARSIATSVSARTAFTEGGTTDSTDSLGA